MTPVIGVGLGTKWDNGTGTLQQIASGAHDDVYRGIAEAYRDAGYKTIDVRIGWEMNGNYMPWSSGSTTDSANAWKAAFSHVADVMHSVSGMKVNTVWNPNLSNNNPIPVSQLYPGDDKVDVVGLDLYSHTYKYDGSVSNSQYYNYPAASQYHPTGDDSVQWGLAQTMDLASAHGKPVGIGETGIAVGDNNDLPGAIAAAFAKPGAPQAAFVNVWDVPTPEGDWQFTDGHNSGAGQAWAAAFSGGSSNAPAPVEAASAPAPAATADTAASTDTAPAADAGSSAAVTSATVNTYNGNVIFLSPNANRAEAAWGPMDVAGDSGPDLYVVHPGDSDFTIENFSLAKGDVLNISPSLQDTFAQTQTNGGTLVSFAGDSNHTANVFLKGVASIDPAKIDWS